MGGVPCKSVVELLTLTTQALTFSHLALFLRVSAEKSPLPPTLARVAKSVGSATLSKASVASYC